MSEKISTQSTDMQSPFERAHFKATVVFSTIIEKSGAMALLFQTRSGNTASD
ncbi:MAG: hypothetical protein KDA17_00730 [Candidatus Saccharibacteria bacterium]|nr:hypothetical protein [Candidatus Saccharibacteria bacterium]MCA9336873.1 hypothetical protein [Candidatus Saccharibacteria bacterium]MCA9339418.1 hypothetical protein [Candidatus Saccharibacteria bacterium]HPQ82334.1 hypothetical protein [Candidatus Saccharimonas sp.]